MNTHLTPLVIIPRTLIFFHYATEPTRSCLVLAVPPSACNQLVLAGINDTRLSDPTLVSILATSDRESPRNEMSGYSAHLSEWQSLRGMRSEVIVHLPSYRWLTLKCVLSSAFGSGALLVSIGWMPSCVSGSFLALVHLSSRGGPAAGCWLTAAHSSIDTGSSCGSSRCLFCTIFPQKETLFSHGFQSCSTSLDQT